MPYEVIITPQALEHIRETVRYISKELLAPETAKAWADRLEKEISSLDSMPLRFPLVEEEPWKSKGVHRFNIKNFMVYYIVQDSKVFVTAVIYGRRDQIAALKNMEI